MSDSKSSDRKVLVVKAGEGRTYNMGRMRAVFFADGEDTDARYSISEWWLEPRTEGPGAHSHAEHHILYVLAGTLTLRIDEARTDAARGAYALIPGGVQHDFENHGADECGFISINAPGGFEQMMPQLVQWFKANPLGDVQEP